MSTVCTYQIVGTDRFDAMEEFMSSVATVWRVCPQLAALPHVMRVIDAFLWLGASHWSLEAASKRGFVCLLDLLLKHERPEYNRRCREMRLKFAIKEAVESGYTVAVLKWWVERYSPDLVSNTIFSVFELAIKHANLLALEWLYEENRCAMPLLKSQVPCFDPNIIIWLHDRGGYHSCTELALSHLRCRWTASSLVAFRQCLTYEDSSFRISGVETAVAKAIELEDLDTLQWIHVYRSDAFLPLHLNSAILNGNREVAKWLLQAFPKSYFGNPQLGLSSLRNPGICQLDLDFIQWMESAF